MANGDFFYFDPHLESFQCYSTLICLFLGLKIKIETIKNSIIINLNYYYQSIEWYQRACLQVYTFDIHSIASQRVPDKVTQFNIPDQDIVCTRS